MTTRPVVDGTGLQALKDALTAAIAAAALSTVRVYATYAAAVADLPGKDACEVRVTADEKQDGDMGRYSWSGTKLFWIPMQEVEI